MTWRPAFTLAEVRQVLDPIIGAANVTAWEVDIDVAGDITLLAPINGEASFQLLGVLAFTFFPDDFVIEAINMTLPPDGNTRLRLNLCWAKGAATP